MKILVTGTAGFIGFHLAKELLANNHEVIGLDSINDYYDTKLKYDRLTNTGIDNKEIEYNKLIQSSVYPKYHFIQLNLEDKPNINRLFETEGFDIVINLAAQAGVRYSLTHPDVYVQSNIVGFLNIIEASRYNNIKHLVYASSSSVYGLNKKQPFTVHQNVDHPISIYAASKKANELMAHTYSHLYNLPTTGLRFFTVYGPWGRPDMALFIFTKAALAGEKISVFNHGKMKRDFTFIDDIVEGIKRVSFNIPKSNSTWDATLADSATSSAPYRVYNIGNNNPVMLMDYINAIEKKLSIEISKEYLSLQAGDVPETYADVSNLITDVGYKPSTKVEDGVSKFIDWYKQYYNV